MTTQPHQLHLIAVCLAALICTATGAGDWDYDDHGHGPSTWATNYPQFCAGVKQSPIALSTMRSNQESLIKKFVFQPNTPPASVNLTLKNDGHKLELSWSPSLVVKMGLSSTDLTHTAAQLHWHWGSSPDTGSEHTLDGKSYAAEGHLVFYNEKDYGNFTYAADKPYGLAVLGIFYQLSDHGNPLFDVLYRTLENGSLVSSSSSATLTADNFDIIKLFLPTNTDEFFRYDGSLTTPPCYESVLWTVYRQPVSISQTQLDQLRRLTFTNNKTMVNNYRPPLQLNPDSIRASTPRTVYRTFSAAGSVSSLPLAAVAAIAALAATASRA